MRAAVVVFPGSNCDQDCYHVLKHVMGVETSFIWHKATSLEGADLVVLPGGFSYGDYLRCGAIACFSPIMEAVNAHARSGGLTLGICNGFQMLTEAGLLPGALIQNLSLKFLCQDVQLKVEHTHSALTSRITAKSEITIPVAHNEGNYTIGSDGLARLEGEGQILFRYMEADGSVRDRASLNGSMAGIAGIMNAGRNVFGMMPHPERCAEALVGGPAQGGNTDGRLLFEGLVAAVQAEA
jgi:phosphoribosylformylglycinamidine synthase I